MTILTAVVLISSLSAAPAQNVDKAEAVSFEVLLEREKLAHNETREECEQWKLRCAELELELSRMEEERFQREREWLGYTRAIAGLSNSVIPTSVVFESVLQEQEEARVEEEAQVQAERASRSHEVFVALRSLFVAEGIEGYDLLEAGVIHDGATGPVVLRMLDRMRRPVGSLSAARLRLEGSETGHTLTLIFEEGYERRGGLKLPFQGGTLQDLSGSMRRIVLPSVDPGPWREALPELFSQDPTVVRTDDGKWDSNAVRKRLNELLREDAPVGYFRLRTIAGVFDEALCEVHLEERDAEHRILRRFFADRMRLEALEHGIRITLESGAQVRGGEKLPFLDGRFRIYLPGARLDAWCDGNLPGLDALPGAPGLKPGFESPEQSPEKRVDPPADQVLDHGQ